MAAADTLSKDHHLRAMATMRVLPYVILRGPRSCPFSFSPTAVPGPLISSLGPADESKNGQQGHDRERHAQKNDGRKETKRSGLIFDVENEQMQYQQGPPQQVVVKEKKKNQGCLAVW